MSTLSGHEPQNKFFPGWGAVVSFLEALKTFGKNSPNATRLIGVATFLVVGPSILNRLLDVSFIQALGMSVGFLALGAVGLAVANSIAKSKSILATFLSWVFGILVAAFGVLLVAAFAFGQPKGVAVWLARALNAPELIAPGNASPVIVEGELMISALPSSMLDPELPYDRFERIEALKQRPELVIRPGAKLVFDGTNARMIAVRAIRLEGGKVVTKGGDLTIEAVDLASNGGEITTMFEQPAQQGQSATNGGAVKLRIHSQVSGNLKVDLTGQTGAPGIGGANGANGSNGAAGDNAVSSLLDCKSGAGDGRPGGDGGNGQTGGTGGQGGYGGQLIVETANPEYARNVVAVSLNGGKGGAGGPGGAGGNEGHGGPGGSARPPYCQGGGNPGPNGKRGVDGTVGNPGAAGGQGQVEFRPIS